MKLESYVALLSAITALCAFYFPYRSSVRKEKAQRLQELEDDQKEAILAAVAPVKAQLDKM